MQKIPLETSEKYCPNLYYDIPACSNGRLHAGNRYNSNNKSCDKRNKKKVKYFYVKIFEIQKMKN